MDVRVGDSATPWELWQPGETLKEVRGITPLLASWDAGHHPAQIRLRAYLGELAAALGPLPPEKGALYLHLDVDVQHRIRLTTHHDLENYLTPLVKHLGAARFRDVSAAKFVGGGSRVVVGYPIPRDPLDVQDGWGHFSCCAGGGCDSRRWKEDLRQRLRDTGAGVLPPGPVAVHLAWRCSSERNWANLWKATGDAMGPVLGEPDPHHPFCPADDRIVKLGLHLNLQDRRGHGVDVGMWWRPCASER